MFSILLLLVYDVTASMVLALLVVRSTWAPTR